MICLFPTLDILPLFIELLDSLPYTPSEFYGEIPTGQQIVPVVKPPECSDFELKNTLKAKEITFGVQFLFDGWKTTYTDEVIEVYPPPDFCFNSSLIVFNGYDMEITVSWRRHIVCF
jgi:hypothetical protein